MWVEYFSGLAKSKVDEIEGLRELNHRVLELLDLSRENEEGILDTPFILPGLEPNLL